jgi:hypothetical protein
MTAAALETPTEGGFLRLRKVAQGVAHSKNGGNPPLMGAK